MIILIEAPSLVAWDMAAFLIDHPKSLMLARVNDFLSQLAKVTLKTATAGPIFLVIKGLLLCSSLSLVLAMYSFMSLKGKRH